MTTGYQIIDNQLWISKDPSAQLLYGFDWSEWLPQGDSLQSVNYTVTARVNDPAPLVKEDTTLDTVNKKTYVSLSGGQTGKSYVVTANITTANGLIDSRYFKVKVEKRSA